jgi:hypothetical protein
MRTFFGRRRKRKMTAVVALVMALLVAAFAAWAYFKSPTGASGSAATTLGSVPSCTGTSLAFGNGNCAIAVTTLPASGSLGPGGSGAAVFEIQQQCSISSGCTNGGQNTLGKSYYYNLASPTATFTSTDSGCQSFLTANPGTFTASGWTWTQIQQPGGSFSPISGTGVQGLQWPAASAANTAKLDGQLTVNFNDSPTVDQSACAGKNLTVSVQLG